MNFHLGGLNDLNFYFGVIALVLMAITLTGILLDLKIRSLGYKLFVLFLSLGTSVLAYFCYRHEVNFPMIGALFAIESAVGFVIVFMRKS